MKIELDVQKEQIGEVNGAKLVRITASITGRALEELVRRGSPDAPPPFPSSRVDASLTLEGLTLRWDHLEPTPPLVYQVVHPAAEEALRAANELLSRVDSNGEHVPNWWGTRRAEVSTMIQRLLHKTVKDAPTAAGAVIIDQPGTMP